MAYTWLDGFEHQVPALEILFNFGTNAQALAYDTNDVGNGISYAAGRISGSCLHMEQDGVNVCNYSAGFAATQNAVLSIWVRLPGSPPGQNSVILTLRDSGGNQLAGVRISTTGTLDARAGTGTFDTGPSLTDNEWHRLDLWADTSCTTFGGTTWGITWAVDGSSQGTATQGTHVATNMESIQLGSSTASHNALFELDDGVMTDTGGDYPLGSHEITFFVPTVDDIVSSNYGSPNGMEVGGSGLTLPDTAGADIDGVLIHAYNKLDEWPVGSNVDYVQQNGIGSGEHADVGFDEHPDQATIVAVRGIAAVNSSGGTANDGTVDIRDESNVLVGTIYSGDMSDTEVRYQAAMIPAPGGGWTDFSGIKATMGRSTTQGATPRWQAIGLMVATASQDADATPATVAAVAALTTPTPAATAAATPATVAGVAALPAPTTGASVTATPNLIPAVAEVETPSISTVTDAVATPATIMARAALPTAHIQVTTVTGDFYAFGYGGYVPTEEEPEPEPPVAPVIPSPTPTLSVQVDFITDTGLASEPRWFELVDMVRSPQGFAIRRGRQRALDRNEAGTVTVVFGDPDRVLDPDNTDSPYYPFVVPFRRIRLAAVVPRDPVTEAFTTGGSYVGGEDAVGGGDEFDRVPLFDGLIESYMYDYPGPGKDAVVTINATDWLGALARESFSLDLNNTTLLTQQPLLNYAVYSAERMHVILDQKAWTHRRMFDRDRVELDGTPSPGHPRSKQMEMKTYTRAAMLSSIEEAAGVDGGNFFVTPDGYFRYRDPEDQFLPFRSEYTFEHGVNDFADVGWVYEDSLIYNDIRITSQFGDKFYASTTSQQKYLVRSLDISLPFANETDVDDRGDELLIRYAEPRKVVQRLEFNASTEDWRLVLATDLWQKVLVRVELPNGDIVEQPSLVEGIEILSPHERDWQVVWWLSLTPYPELVDEDSGQFITSIGTWEDVSNASLLHGSLISTYTAIEYSGPNDLPRPITRSSGIPAHSLYIEEVVDASVVARSGPFEVEPGRPHRAKLNVAQIYAGGFASEFATVHLELYWYDANDNFLSNAVGDSVTFDVLFPFFGQKPLQALVLATSPPAATQARIYLYASDMPDLATNYPRGLVVTDVSLQRVN